MLCWKSQLCWKDYRVVSRSVRGKERESAQGLFGKVFVKLTRFLLCLCFPSSL